MQVLRGFWSFCVALGWVAGSLAFSALSLGAVIGLAFLLRYAFPFLPNIAVGPIFLLAFIIYIVIIGWIAWRIIRRRLGVR